jgi:hypothetical protein
MTVYRYLHPCFILMYVMSTLDTWSSKNLYSCCGNIPKLWEIHTIDLENETIEMEDDCSIDDILESAGILTPEQAQRINR